MINLKKKPTEQTENITPCEIRVLQMKAEGFSEKRIAAILFISTETVSNHSRSAVRKLKANNAFHAGVIAHRRHIISLDVEYDGIPLLTS